MIRFRFAAAFACALGVVFHAASALAACTAQCSVVIPTSGPHSLGDYTLNYLNPALASLLAHNAGSTAPANGPGGAPVAWQSWLDTSTTPATLRIYDGAQWVAVGTVDATGHVFSATNASGTGGVPFGYFATGSDAGNLTGTVASARLSGAYTGITGVGALTSLTVTSGAVLSSGSATVTTAHSTLDDGTGIFTAGTGIVSPWLHASGVGATIGWLGSGYGTDSNFWDANIQSGGSLHFRACNDVFSACNDWLSVTRSGYVPQLATFNVPLTFSTVSQGVVETDSSGKVSSGLPFSVDIKQSPYNAKCDDTTDDGAAIGAALQALAAHISTTGVGGKLIGCAGETALIRTSINATGLNTGGYDTPLFIDMGGMRLDCQTGSTYACFDMTEDNYIHLRGLYLLGASGANESNIGLQLVDPTDAGTTSSHENVFEDLTITGNFKTASVYLESAEANHFNSCYLNNFDSAAAATLVLDGYNHFNAKSAYYTITRTQDSAKTFSGDVFNCEGIQSYSTSPAMWIGNAYGFRFASYESTEGPTANVLYQMSGSIDNQDLKFDEHIEAFPYLLQDFLITAPSGITTVTIPQVTFTDGINEAADYVFKIDPSSSITSAYLYNLKVNISSWNNGSGLDGGTAPVMFGATAADFFVTGRVSVPTSAWWVNPGSWNGELFDQGESVTAAAATFGSATIGVATINSSGESFSNGGSDTRYNLATTGAATGEEYGSETASDTPYRDWHSVSSGGVADDYDVREQVSGGTHGSNGTGTFTMLAGKVNLSAPVQFGSYTVSTLPSGFDGAHAYVTDATACSTLGGSLTGGGSTHCPVYYNGSTWVQG